LPFDGRGKKPLGLERNKERRVNIAAYLYFKGNTEKRNNFKDGNATAAEGKS